MIHNPYNLMTGLTRSDINQDVDGIQTSEVKKKSILGLRLGHHKLNEHLKRADEELTQLKPNVDDREM